MSNLDNLTAKILSDSEARAKEITGAAQAQADAQVAAAVAAAKAEAEKIIADAHVEAGHQAEQIVQGKQLSIRDEALGLKREMLDKVFESALQKLNAMPKDEFLAYLGEYLSKLELDGEEILIPKKYGITSVSEIVHVGLLAELFGKGPNLKLCADENRSIDGGFVLIKKGIEQNHTFASLVGYYRDELEAEALKILYA